ncbi:MAG: lasso RiPP family leader peptide-containing protein [Gemmatimonadales bacterium]|nr:lasso RiPP family leader peptide-containing protein [Gemmatimonadales bacterium]
MYEKPVLERFGTFRDLTLQQGKKDPGADLTSALNCEANAGSGSAAACGGTGGSGGVTRTS